MTSDRPVDRRRSVASIVKAMSIIDAFTVQSPELSAADLAALTGMDRTSIHRFLRTLVDLGQLEQSAISRKYRLGLKVLDPAYALLDAMEVRAVAASHLVEFHARTQRWVAVGVPHGLDIIIVERMWGGGEVNSVFQLGHRLSMTRSSMGQCVLAGMSEPDRSALLDQLVLERDAELDVEQLVSDLKEIATTNIAHINQGLWPNLRSVGSAFFDASNAPVGAITTWNDASQPIDDTIAQEMADVAMRISYSLGFRGFLG